MKRLAEPAAGDLNRRVTLRRRDDLPAADGTLVSEFSEEKQRWASIDPVGTAIYSGSVQVDDKITHRIILRFLGVVTIDFEVVYANVVYRVKRAIDMNGGHRFTLLEVEELGQLQPNGGLYA
ncbi:phage head closure protein [Pseudomonas sp. Marseille-Q5115]|uniref:phage head closure protein n=1 Tax=Pseudomonas sp. Marseille-Q5115 TaxID=2866593 RepID=UPI001CE42A4C|nr:phage head closure protein [Pseudomonas sp. Marseille-Q5115]